MPGGLPLLVLPEFRSIVASASALVGVGAFALMQSRPALVERAQGLSLFRLKRLYDRGYAGTIAGADAVTRAAQNGNLRNYVPIVILTLLALLARPLILGRTSFPRELTDTYAIEVILAGVIVTAALAATLLTSRFAVAAILGIIGISVMLLYVIFGALDLAITQIIVEALTVIVLVLVLYHLPLFVTHSTRWVYFRDGVVSLIFGGVISLLECRSPNIRSYTHPSACIQRSLSESATRRVESGRSPPLPPRQF